MSIFSRFLRGFFSTLVVLALLGLVLFLLGVISQADIPWAVFVGTIISLMAGIARATIKRH